MNIKPFLANSYTPYRLARGLHIGKGKEIIMPYAITGFNPAPYSGIHPGITGALQEASVRTGAGFDHLVTTAMRESSLNPAAKARGSSATGMFQFIEQTWLGMVRKHGAEHGLGAQAAQIFQDSGGRYIVPDAGVRREILALRQDTHISALMAGELSEDNRKVLESRLDRGVSDGELYAAHVLGAGGAVRLIRAVEETPAAAAANVFPSAARANPGIFYEKGRARSLAEVSAFLTREGTKPDFKPAPAPVYAVNRTPVAPAPGSSVSPAAVRPVGNAYAGTGHGFQVLAPETIAIMASLDAPGNWTSGKPHPRNRDAAGLLG